MSHGFPRPLNNSIAVGGADFITLPYERRSLGTRRKAKVKTFLPPLWGRSSIRAATVRERSASRLLTRAAPRLALSRNPQLYQPASRPYVRVSSARRAPASGLG